MSAEGEASAIFRLTPFVRSWSTTGTVGSDDAAEFAVCTGIEEDDDAEPDVVAVCPAVTEPETVMGDAAAAAVAVALPDTGTDCVAVAAAVLCCSADTKVLDG